MLPSWIIAEVERRRREREAEERRPGLRVELPELPRARERPAPVPGSTVIVSEIG
jgi:hypothetical protein